MVERATWWGNEIKEKISLRQELYKKVINGREDLYGMSIVDCVKR